MHLGWFVGGMQQVSLFADVGAAITEIIGACRLRHRGQVQYLKPGVVFQEIANEVVDMDPLHHEHNARSLLVVRPGHQGRTIPLDNALAGRFGVGVARLERVIDDEKTAAAASQRSPDRCGVAPTA